MRAAAKRAAYTIAVAAIIFPGCAAEELIVQNFPQITHSPAETDELFVRDPDLEWRLLMLQVPNDDKWHYGGNAAREHSKTGVGGWYAAVSFKHAIPWPLPSPTPKPIVPSPK